MTTEAASRRVFRSKVDAMRPTYGFEDVSLAPGTDTVEPSDVDLSTTIAGIPLELPVMAAAMDAVVDARFAGALAALGGLAVLNLEGVQARFDDPDAVLERIATAPDAARPRLARGVAMALPVVALAMALLCGANPWAAIGGTVVAAVAGVALRRWLIARLAWEPASDPA